MVIHVVCTCMHEGDSKLGRENRAVEQGGKAGRQWEKRSGVLVGHN